MLTRDELATMLEGSRDQLEGILDLFRQEKVACEGRSPTDVALVLQRIEFELLTVQRAMENGSMDLRQPAPRPQELPERKKKYRATGARIPDGLRVDEAKLRGMLENKGLPLIEFSRRFNRRLEKPLSPGAIHNWLGEDPAAPLQVVVEAMAAELGLEGAEELLVPQEES